MAMVRVKHIQVACCRIIRWGVSDCSGVSEQRWGFSSTLFKEMAEMFRLGKAKLERNLFNAFI